MRRLAAWLVAGNLIVALSVVLATVLALRASREADEVRARETTENLASSLSIELGAELKQVDNALATIALQYRRVRGTEAELRRAMERAIADQRSLLPQVDVIRITDASGQVVYGLAAEEHQLNVADRDYFSLARNGAGMVVSEPLYGRLLAQWGIVVARRLEGENGQFAGVAYTVLSTDHFVDNFRHLAIGPEGAISLRSLSMRLIARYSAAEPQSNRGLGEIIVSEDFVRQFARDPTRGWYLTPTRIDNIERITAYRQVRGYPLIILTGTSTADFLTAWRSEAQQQSLLAAIVILTALACSYVVYRQQRRELRAREQVSRLAAEQSLMLDNELVGMARVRGELMTWKNRALDALFGYDSQALIQQPTRALYLDQASYDHVAQQAQDAFAQGRRYRQQLRMRRKDGSALWIDLSGAPVSAQESIWMMVDVSALKESEVNAQHLAVHDALTGLPNRVRFADRLTGALSLLDDRSSLLAVCYVDLDGFKDVNDQFGHDAGDLVLRVVAQRLQAGVRSHDLVARLGGDEFGVLLASLRSEAEAEPALHRLLNALREPIRLPDGGEAAVGASIGIAFAPRHGRQSDLLMRSADAAMYQAKRNGKHQFAMATTGAPVMTSSSDFPAATRPTEDPAADRADPPHAAGPAPAAPSPAPSVRPTPVPEHAFEESVAGEEDPGAGMDNDENRVPPSTLVRDDPSH
ncbi:sensor domain-containing diguanylate cyclase [Roseateles amylovorans]|uniref:Diguanylate cyclase n=1 Tax=Roseateles amylovorans TaxID=2978473 RepID=A0ABY6B7Z2_9BURK|nr:diguanylate cyclase [Roseateles amylovorans]UXH80580.1 diguanylate cyclase [Roseateles amylovorans]